MTASAHASPGIERPRMARARRALVIGGLATVLTLVGGAALYVWITKGGNILFDLAAVFCA